MCYLKSILRQIESHNTDLNSDHFYVFLHTFHSVSWFTMFTIVCGCGQEFIYRVIQCAACCK